MRVLTLCGVLWQLVQLSEDVGDLTPLRAAVPAQASAVWPTLPTYPCAPAVTAGHPWATEMLIDRLQEQFG